MPDEGSQAATLAELVPQEVLAAISEKIKSGIADAEALFGMNRKDEDALTGALGQAMSTPRTRLVVIGGVGYE